MGTKPATPLEVYKDLYRRRYGTDPDSQFDVEFQRVQARRLADKAMDMEAVPDYRDIINPVPDEGDEPYLIEGFVRRGENTGLIIPTNTGGSTLLINLGASAILGKPFLGHFHWTVDPESVVVVWVNPEEAHETPKERFRAVGLTEKQIREQVIHLYVREKRLYLNEEMFVDGMIDSLHDRGLIPDSDKEVILIVDGFDGTAKGDLWNSDFEAWKNGLGRLKLAVGAENVFVRAQLTTEAGRRVERGERPNINEVRGGQFATWPDLRIVYWPEFTSPGKGKRKTKTGNRRMELRGRRIGATEFTVSYDEETGGLHMVGVSQKVLATARVAHLANDEMFHNAVTSEAIKDATNVTNVAEWMHQHFETFRKDGVEPVSLATYRKTLSTELGVDGLKKIVEGLR